MLPLPPAHVRLIGPFHRQKKVEGRPVERDIVRGRLERVPATNDYVLVVRQGLPEAAEANGSDWLQARVDEVLGKAAA